MLQIATSIALALSATLLHSLVVVTQTYMENSKAKQDYGLHECALQYHDHGWIEAIRSIVNASMATFGA